MDVRRFVVIMIIVAIVVIFSFYTITTLQARKKRMTRYEKFVRVNKRFRFYWDFFPTRHTFRNMYQQIGNLSVYSFMDIRYNSVKFFETSMLMAVGLFAVGLFGFRDVISAILVFLLAVVLLQNNINKKIDNVNYQTYKAMSVLLASMRETYTRTQSISDTLNECECPEILQIQVDKIYKIVTANNGARLLSTFYEECPNRTMRTLATTCYIRNDTGDDVGKGSPFKEALSLIKDEVDAEQRRQLNQRLLFGTIEFLPFVPLFLYPLLELAYGKIIPATQAVFDSFWGYLIKLMVVLVSLVCYYILTTMNNSSAAAIDDRMDFITNLVRKPRIQYFARTLIPKNFKKRHKLEEDLKGCLSSKTLEYFYLEKFIFAIIGGIAAVVFSIFILISSRASMYNSVTALTMTSSMELTREERDKLLAFDHDMLTWETPPDDTDGSISKELKRILPRATDLDLDAQLQRIQSKYKMYHNLVFHWWFAFIYIGTMILGWNVSNLLLRIRVSLVKEEAMIDVLQLQTVIAILMDTPMDTFGVIYWLMRSSDIHKDILTDCYNYYPGNPEKAIRNLKDQVTIPEFVQICDKLLITIYQISIKEAFEDLVQDRQNVMKIREMTQAAELKSKRSKASPVAMAPMVTWIGLEFILPILITTVNSATSMLANLSEIM